MHPSPPTAASGAFSIESYRERLANQTLTVASNMSPPERSGDCFLSTLKETRLCERKGGEIWKLQLPIWRRKFGCIEARWGFQPSCPTQNFYRISLVTKTDFSNAKYDMHTFIEHVYLLQLAARLRLLENFYPLNPQTYDDMFVAELKRLATRINNPAIRQELEELENFGFTRYISASVRNSGDFDARTLDEKTHDIASQLLVGKLFAGYNPDVHGPFSGRFKISVSNAVKNQASKTRSHRRYLPSVPILADELPQKNLPGDTGAIESFGVLCIRGWERLEHTFSIFA